MWSVSGYTHQRWCVAMTIYVVLDGILKQSIDIYICSNVRDFILRVMLIIIWMEAYCEKYWLLFWFGIWLRWVISMGDYIEYMCFLFFTVESIPACILNSSRSIGRIHLNVFNKQLIFLFLFSFLFLSINLILYFLGYLHFTFANFYFYAKFNK